MEDEIKQVVTACLAESGIEVKNGKIRKADLVKAQTVLAGKFKEQLTKSVILELMDPKHKGTTEIELSLYTNNDPQAVVKDKEALKVIKKGLGAIYSKSVNSRERIGSLVTKAIEKLMFRLTDPAMASSQDAEASIYYVTLNQKDLGYPSSLTDAKRTGKEAAIKAPDAKVEIEVYTGTKHGGGGVLKYKLRYKNGEWKKVD